MQRRNEVWLGLGELSLQQLAEQVVIPVPLAPVVERDQKEVRALDFLQLAARPFVLQHRVADRATHPLQDRGAPQEAQRPGTQP